MSCCELAEMVCGWDSIINPFTLIYVSWDGMVGIVVYVKAYFDIKGGVIIIKVPDIE